MYIFHKEYIHYGTRADTVKKGVRYTIQISVDIRTKKMGHMSLRINENKEKGIAEKEETGPHEAFLTNLICCVHIRSESNWPSAPWGGGSRCGRGHAVLRPFEDIQPIQLTTVHQPRLERPDPIDTHVHVHTRHRHRRWRRHRPSQRRRGRYRSGARRS